MMISHDILPRFMDLFSDFPVHIVPNFNASYWYVLNI